MIEIILTSSVLILLLVILRLVLRGRINPCVQYALWLLVAARLLIPGTLFTAPVSVLGATTELQASLEEVFQVPLPQPVQPAQSTQTVQPAQPTQPAQAEHPDTAPAASGQLSAPAAARRSYNWPDIIWKAGIAVTGSALVLSNLSFYFRLRKKRKRLDLPAAPWSGKLPVYEADGLPSPCLFGLFRPAIYLNEAAMDAEHPEHILAHEYAHYRHGDYLWSILRSICLAIHWYNPLVWWAAALSRRDCELACDAAALDRLGEEERIDYGQTLLGMVSKNSSPAALLHMATTMTAGKRAMTERIHLIIKQPRTRKITLALVALLACVLGACAFGGKGGGVSPEDAALLEFPGLHWNDSMEAVIETLGITEEQIVSIDEMNPGEPYVTVKDFQYFGETTQNAYFYFKQYAGTQDEPGLIGVRLDYPDDMDFAPVREELARLYGEGSGAGPDFYTLSDSGSIQPVGKNSRTSSGDGFQEDSDFLKRVYGEELLERRAAILEEPGPHGWYWTSDSSALSGEFVQKAAAWLVEARSNSASPSFQPPALETAEEFYRMEPLVYLWWTDAAPITSLRITSTVNQVQWVASEYVMTLQCITGGENGSSAQPVSVERPDPLFQFPGLHWNDSVETVMETLGVTEADFIDSSSNDSDGSKTFDFAVENIPFFGYTAQYVVCRFEQYGENGLGLYSVQVSFPDDMEDFDAVWDELVRQYGPASKEKDGVRQILPSWKEVLGERYDRWEELQKQPGINTVTWDLAPEALPEGVIASIERYFRLFWQNRHPEDTMEDYLDQFPLGRLTWCSNSMFTPTFNTVTFEGGGYVYCLQNPLENEVLENARDVVGGIQAGGYASGWLPCMAYMDWNLIRQAAGEQGLDPAETEQGIIDAIYEYIDRNGKYLTQGEYTYILTATAGLTGTPKEGNYHGRSDIPLEQMPLRYGDLVYRLYVADPGQFAYVVLNLLPEEQQNEVLDFFRNEIVDMAYNHDYEARKDNCPSREEAVHRLEGDLAESLDQEITEIVFHGPGESAQYRFVGAQGVGAATFESENPEIATVNMIGLIVAVAPGETNINAHYEGNGVQKDFVCHIICDW